MPNCEIITTNKIADKKPQTYETNIKTILGNLSARNISETEKTIKAKAENITNRTSKDI